MAFDFIKRIFKAKEEKKEMPQGSIEVKKEQAETPKAQTEFKPPKEEIKKEEPPLQQKKAEKKSVSQMSDEELEKELLEKAPELFSHAKTPEMKKMVIDIYRAMLLDNVNVDNEKEVKKWLQKHPEVAQGGSPLPKPQTYKREEPKVGRNDPCPCGSGKKYKKCCGAKE